MAARIVRVQELIPGGSLHRLSILHLHCPNFLVRWPSRRKSMSPLSICTLAEFVLFVLQVFGTVLEGMDVVYAVRLLPLPSRVLSYS